VFGNLREQSRLLLNNGAAAFVDVTATHLRSWPIRPRRSRWAIVDGEW
jgi:hypothetical protein